MLGMCQNPESLSHQHKLTIELDKGSFDGTTTHFGILTRYMTVQIHLLETMKSVKDQVHMTTDCLMLP